MELTIPGVDFEIPLNVVILGTVTGLTYSLIAVGLTLVYKSTRVLNLATGEIGALPALFVPWLVLQNDWPYWVALPLALLGSLAVGGLTEFLVIRRLGQAPRLTAMVATIGLAQSLFALGVLLPDAGQLTGKRYPTPFDWSLTIGDLILGPGQLLILIVAPLSVLALSLFLRRSRIGRASRASAENMEAARLAGVPTVRIQFVVWSIAGLLAGIGAILIGPTRPLALSSALGPSLLLRALGAAMIGGLVSIPGAFAGGIIIGVTEALVLWNYPTGGTLELVIAAFIVVSLLARRSLGHTIRGRDATGWTYARSVRPLPADLARNPRVRVARWSTLAIVLVLASAAPLALTPSNQFMASNVVLFAMMGLSLVVLTGYAGHVSLGQFGFVGIGAGLGGLLLQKEWSYPVAALAVVLAGLGVAFVVGLPALRVRGLFLAVTTLGFALVVANWLFAQHWFVQTKMGFGSSLHIDRPELFGVDFNTERNYYWLCLSVLVVLSIAVYGMRRGGVGRSMIAVRENEASAASLSLAPARVKLTAFMLSGTIAALAGYLYGTLVINFSSNPRETFGPTQSLELVVTAVFGGVTTITGVVLGAAWVEGIPRLLGDDYALLTSGFALILIIVLLPGGLASLVFDVRDRFVSWFVRAPLPRVLRPLGAPVSQSQREHEHELAHELAIVSAAATTQWARADARERTSVAVPLRAEHVTVNFGGLKALDDVTIEVRNGEILGLMGPNGAGKTTLFDVLTGAVRPTAGRVLLDERDVTRLAVHRRARLGLGRTYQQALLFGDLTLLESIKVSLERTLPTHTVPALVGFPTSLRRERQRNLRATEIVELLDLGEYAHRSMTELPTGIRRLAELGCVIGLDAHVLLLDEPTAGFTAREIEGFTRIVRNVRDYLGATIVVIDHDVPMMRSLVERLYVLASGELIAEGEPSLLESHDTVADAYLGGRRNLDTLVTPI